MAQQIVCTAFAKVNLFLELTGKLDNGYHALDSLMQSVTLSDTVTVTERYSGISVECGSAGIPNDEHNIAYKCASAFFAARGKDGGCRIEIEKHIPVCAGMGGGSADGAAVLVALDILYGIPFSEEKLCEIGGTVGADIPFCIKGGLCKVKGFGDITEKQAFVPDFFLLVVKPEEGISTGAAFSALDAIHDNYIAYTPVSSEAAFEALQENSAEAAGKVLYNCFEASLKEKCPVTLSIIADLKQIAGNGLLSGSGSAVFALFDTEAKAESAGKIMSEKYPDCFIKVCGCSDRGVALKEFNEVE